MKKFLKFGVLTLAVLTCGAAFMLAGCDEDPIIDPDGENNNSGEITDPDAISYSVTLKNSGGDALAGYTISLNDEDGVVASGTTNTQGTATISAVPAVYTLSVDTTLPTGYSLAKTYTTDEAGTAVTMYAESSVIQAATPSGTKYTTGTLMYDFTVSTVKTKNRTAEEWNLATVLETKKAVLISFFYVGCTYCELEFPYIQEAYEEYGDDLEIIVLSVYYDDNASLSAWGMTGAGRTYDFAVALDSNSIFYYTGYSTVPTSMLVDRYGMIVYCENGYVNGVNNLTSTWTTLFETYTCDEYAYDYVATASSTGVDYALPDTKRSYGV